MIVKGRNQQRKHFFRQTNNDIELFEKEKKVLVRFWVNTLILQGIICRSLSPIIVHFIIKIKIS